MKGTASQLSIANISPSLTSCINYSATFSKRFSAGLVFAAPTDKRGDRLSFGCGTIIEALVTVLISDPQARLFMSLWAFIAETAEGEGDKKCGGKFCM